MTTDFYGNEIKVGSKVRWNGRNGCSNNPRVVTEITKRGGILFAGSNRKDYPAHCYVIVD